jgi:GNAT superfamily N-acetyltransferase
MQIRAATAEDFERVLVPIRRFHEASGYKEIVEFDEASFRKTYDVLLGKSGVCLIAEADGEVVGVAGAMVYPFYWNSAHMTGQELFWWVNPEHRGSTLGKRMFNALEHWAKEKGCKSFMMICLETLKPEEVEKAYLRAGYRKSERVFIKEL